MKEREIMIALGFDLNFPTTFSFLKTFFYKCFFKENSEALAEIEQLCVFSVRLALFDYSIHYTYKPSLIAYACLLHGIDTFFQGKESQFTKSKNKSIIQIEESQMVQAKPNNFLNYLDLQHKKHTE